jgi:ATP-dependent Clp protease ATP-binding subunit ClpB
MEIKLDVAESALAEVARAGFDPVYGARPLRRAIQSEIENPLAKRILEGEFGAKDTVKIAAKGGVIQFAKG